MCELPSDAGARDQEKYLVWSAVGRPFKPRGEQGRAIAIHRPCIAVWGRMNDSLTGGERDMRRRLILMCGLALAVVACGDDEQVQEQQPQEQV